MVCNRFFIFIFNLIDRAANINHIVHCIFDCSNTFTYFNDKSSVECAEFLCFFTAEHSFYFTHIIK